MIAGLAVPLLLFADDMVLVARTRALTQRLLDLLSGFCAATGFEVNLDKTVWMLGGEVGAGVEPGDLFYRTARIKRVESFKYLGLVMTGHAVGSMVTAREAAAKKAWGQLLGMLTQRGWRDRAIRLLLFDTFVKTCLLYGCAVWGR